MKFGLLLKKLWRIKSFGDIWNNKSARSALVLVPLFMAFILPSLFLALLIHAPLNSMNGVDRMLGLILDQAAGMNQRQGMFYLMTNMICPMLFLMIPLLSSCISAACSLVGEKESGTLETLLLTSLNARKIFKAKILGCVLLSTLVTAVSFIVFSIVTAVGDIMLSMPFYLNWYWFVLVFLLSPAVIIFGALFMALISVSSKRYTELIQTSGYLVLPIVLLFTGQFTGLFRVGTGLLMFISFALFIVDALLCLISARRFTSEKILH
jgi:ABC-type Na+ efflux pump permease subunit